MRFDTVGWEAETSGSLMIRVRFYSGSQYFKKLRSCSVRVM